MLLSKIPPKLRHLRPFATIRLCWENPMLPPGAKNTQATEIQTSRVDADDLCEPILVDVSMGDLQDLQMEVR